MKRALGAVAIGVALAMAVSACRRGHDQSSAAHPADEAPIVVKADTEGLLLTWIDDHGDFHVETKVGDVPLMGRDSVRVVDPNREEGTHADRIFVVDLRQLRADGTYAVQAMARGDFEALAVARREKAGPTLTGTASAPSPTASAEPGDPGVASEGARPLVIIYGADWCSACHDAARYLRKKGIAFVEKNIEKDPAAAREMQAKLHKSGLQAGSIPVIDVRGRVMVGFNASEIDGALGRPL